MTDMTRKVASFLLGIAFTGFMAETVMPDVHEAASVRATTASVSAHVPLSDLPNGSGEGSSREEDSHPIHIDHCSHGHGLTLTHSAEIDFARGAITERISTLSRVLSSISSAPHVRPPIA